MIEPWINDVVIGLAGFVVGSIGALGLYVDPERVVTPSRLPDEGRMQYWKRTYADQERRTRNAPRAASLVGFALLAFVGVLVLIIAVTPLEMRWWFFLGGFAVASLALGTSAIRSVTDLRRRRSERN